MENKIPYFVVFGNDTKDGHKVVIVTDDDTAKDDPYAVRCITVYSLKLAQDIARKACYWYKAEYIELLGYQ